MTWVRIGDILTFASNFGVHLERGAVDVSAQELQIAVKTAFSHLDDWHLQNACCGGQGPLADYHEIKYEDYLVLLKEIEIQEAEVEAKTKHTRKRRTEFNASRSRLVLAMIDAGIRYSCAQPDCNVHADLTVDHIVPLSRGGTDELSNLQFLCASHNSAKRDKLIP
jgi:HNH endonuclease